MEKRSLSRTLLSMMCLNIGLCVFFMSSILSGSGSLKAILMACMEDA
jgi:hypothetical protein